MKREIKFRAWGNIDKKMFYWNINDAQSDWVVPDQEVSDYMQFTGLKDKNGKEIYEKDICKNGDWEQDANAYNYRVEEVRYNEQEASFSGWNYNGDGMTCEVIGNIFENPKLNKKGL